MHSKKNKNTHFLFVVNTYNGFGGAERQSLIFASYIKKYISNNVMFLAFEDGEMFKAMIQNEQIETHYFPFNHKASKFNKTVEYYRLVQFVKKIKPDALIPYVSESNKIIAQIWKYTGASFAFWNQRDEGRKLYGTAHEKKLILGVSAVVSNSYEGRDALVNTYNLEPNKITVINNGIIPYTKIKPSIDVYSSLEIEKTRPIISMIANITSRKDHTTLLKAWAIVTLNCKVKNLEIPFLILAGRKSETYDELRLLAFDLNLSNHIAFVGELNPVQDIISQSLFCVFSSNLEGCPNGVLECMEQGKAVVGSNISGLRQAMGDKYKNICLSEPNNPNSLAEKILGIITNVELREEIGLYNAERIREEFSVKQMVANYLKLINIT
jgi:glycosyltransferase involved in cell wall biosynthesis